MFNRRVLLGVIAFLLALFIGKAFAFSNFSLTTGTVDSYDFGNFGPGYAVPGTVLINGFTLRPGESSGWHYHKGQSYVIVVHGTLTEADVDGPNHCSSRQDVSGSAFVETPGHVHNVTNNGNDVVLVWWATVFPEIDGIQSGGTYAASAPSCN